MQRAPEFSIEQLVPITAPMLLLGEVLSYDELHIECRIHHHDQKAFVNHRAQRPAWVGLEYICQAILALQNIQRLCEGKAIKPGFIIGAKRVNFAKSFFELSESPIVRVEGKLAMDATLGVYDGEVVSAGESAVTATVKGVLVEDPESIWGA